MVHVRARQAPRAEDSEGFKIDERPFAPSVDDNRHTSFEAIIRKMLLLMLGLAASAAHAEHLNSLKTFTGIWAPADGGAAPPSIACEKELSSGDRTPSEARPYELLGSKCT